MILSLLFACSDPPPPPPPAPAAPEVEEEPEPAAEDSAPPEEPVSRNRAPRLKKITLTPDPVPSTEKLTLAFQAQDPEDDPIDEDIVWYVNDRKVLGEDGLVLPPKHYRKGDRVFAEIEVSDGRKKSQRKSPEVQVGNSPPRIELPKGGLKKVDGYQVRATDPDDDPLTYRVEEAPPGFSIDRKGVLHYEPSMEVTEGGEFATRIIVEDGSDEFASWELGLKLQPARAAERKLRGQ